MCIWQRNGMNLSFAIIACIYPRATRLCICVLVSDVVSILQFHKS